MQIRYLEAMQAMAKTANSKVIFLPVQTVQQQMATVDAAVEGSTKHKTSKSPKTAAIDYGQEDEGFQRAINSYVIENI